MPTAVRNRALRKVVCTIINKLRIDRTYIVIIISPVAMYFSEIMR